LAHRKGRRLEAVPMRPAEPYRSLKSQGSPSVYFDVVEREIRCRAKLCRKNAARHKAREKIAFRRYLFFTFSRLRVT
jgi:hypothetical protein